MRRVAARVGAFLVIVAVAGWPGQNVRRMFSAAYCATVGSTLTAVSFKDGAGHARVIPAPPTTVRRPGENVTADAEVELSLDGSSGHPRLGVNLRRDAYLPLLLLIGAIAVAPLRMRSKAICLLLGAPFVLAASLAALATLVAWVFAGGLGPPTAMNSPTLDVAVRVLLAPPGNRFIAPLALAAILILWRLRAERRTDRQPALSASVVAASKLPTSVTPPSALPPEPSPPASTPPPPSWLPPS
jgi:hypothetical protein